MKIYKKAPYKRTLSLTNSKYNLSNYRNQPLISAEIYYSREIKKLSRPRDGWAVGLCPLHDDHNPSLAVNLHHGGWRCLAGCGSGLMVDFQMKKYSQSFKEAINALKI